MNQIVPVNIDFFALIIFLGAAQGIFLAFFFLGKKHREYLHNRYAGIFLLSMSVICLDVLLCYTNYMFKFIYLNDSTEPFTLLLGPSFFLYIYARINNRNPKYYYLHFVPAVFYALYSIPFLLQSNAVKYNGYINAYHPELPFIDPGNLWNYDFWGIRGQIKILILISLLTYSVMIIAELIKYLKTGKTVSEKIKDGIVTDGIVFFVITLSVVVIFISFQHDFGDYIIVTCTAVMIYLFTVKIFNKSEFFKRNTDSDTKYQKSTLSSSEKDEILKRILQQFESEKYYLSQEASLPDLAGKIKSSTNYVSQVINEKMNKSFFELLAYYRIEEAKRLLLSQEKQFEKIESIAYEVGYNSKSAFNISFKKYTGLTPSKFRSNSH